MLPRILRRRHARGMPHNRSKRSTLGDVTHRVIFSLYVEFDYLPGEERRGGLALCVPLDRNGMPSGAYHDGNGRPRAPKRRTIDLRVGDQMMSSGQWRTIKSIRAYRDFWLTDKEAERHRQSGGTDGYVYRLRAD